MPSTSINSDQEALKATSDIQNSTKRALSRIQNNLGETEDIGATTLEELYAQRRKLERIEGDGERLHDGLDEADHLLSKLGSWFGGKRKKNYNKKMNNKNKTKKGKNKELEKENNPQQSSLSSSSSSSAKTKSKWGNKSSKKGSSTKETELSFPPQLLDKEQALYKGEHREQVQQMVADDREIDNQLDQIGNQLTGILQMAQGIGNETKQQGRQLDGINTTMADAKERQIKGNRKIRKHIRPS